jgi:hypothetical protein
MRTACLTFALALLATACGDDKNMTSSNSSTSSVSNSDPSDPGSESGSDAGSEESTATPTTGAMEVCMGKDLMANYGQPCDVDADCVDFIGTPDAKCLKDILMVYGLPGGYCSNNCALPDNMTTFVKGAADCFMGADCIGLDGYFEGCVPECGCDADCPREGYECRRMPTISKEGDPKYCLMTEDNKL